MKYKYEVGGRVKISGKWWEVVALEDARLFKVSINFGGLIGWVPEAIIEAYEPPKPESKPFEWVPKHYDFRQACNGMTHHESVNAWLTEKYGDPTERVYNGEDASGFGLELGSVVLCWSRSLGRWEDCFFGGLSKGDLWRKQPPLLTINKGE